MEELPDRYLNPFTDFGFKKLFGEEPNKELLLDFLNELLIEQEGPIKSLTYLKSEHLGADALDRRAIFDRKTVDELTTRFEKWLYVLRNMNRLDRVPDKLRERIFERLFEVAEIARFSQTELLSYEDSLKYYRDLKNSLDTAREEGREEGRLEGQKAKVLEILKKGLAEGISVEVLSGLTGLSSEEINRLTAL